MRPSLLFLVFCVILSCNTQEKRIPFTTVEIEIIYEDSLSIRAIEIMGNSLAFAADKGVFGTIDMQSGKLRSNVQRFDSILPEFRAVAHTANDFFMLSAGNPALLYKTGDQGGMELVYKEEGEGVFYDAMAFWNDSEGIAFGDSMKGCLSVVITRDGGFSWSKLPCTELPTALENEGAFAASNTNIKIMDDHVWIGTTAGRVLHSPDKGGHWEVFSTPVRKEKPTEGIYSIDFYDQHLGFAVGGDYTDPGSNGANKVATADGGKTWQIMADQLDPGYQSCVRFLPNGEGKELVSLGFPGIFYSIDSGNHWKMLSTEPFYTFRPLNDSVAYAAGRNRIAKLTFR
jgi:photosystem II stability/assembly factor-like uncharacterized protein